MRVTKESVAGTRSCTFLGSLGNMTIIVEHFISHVIQGYKESTALTQSFTFLGSLGNMTIIKMILLIVWHPMNQRKSNFAILSLAPWVT
jgi:hypothetical protein